MKRLLLIVTVIVVLVFPALTLAQETPVYINWIPSDFDGFVRVSMDNPAQTVEQMNFGLYIVSILQPLRLAGITEVPGLNQYFPLDMLDLEQASFEQNVTPWLGDEVVIAYRELGANFQADANNTLMILPAFDSFTSATIMGSVIRGQDLLQRDPYRGNIIYVGDQTAIAIMPQAILIGSEAILRATIDTMFGESESLTANPLYQQIHAQLPAESPISAYVSGEAAAAALPMFLGGSDDALLSAFGGALEGGTAAAMLNGNVNAMGLSYDFNLTSQNEVRATVILATENDVDAAFDSAVLDFIPRSAMIVHSGADGLTAGEHALTAFPLYTFAPFALSSFGVPPLGVPLPTPSSEDITQVIERFSAAVDAAYNINLREDLLAHLDGSYAVAVIPRPNNPIPLWDMPVEVLLIAHVDNPDETIDSLLTLIESFIDDRFERERIDGNAFFTLTAPDSDAPLLKMGSVDHWLVIGSGESVDAALAAYSGDNRLTAQTRWTTLAEETLPNVYVDVNSYLNTFFPQEGGLTQSRVTQMGVYWHSMEGGLFQIDAIVKLS